MEQPGPGSLWRIFAIAHRITHKGGHTVAHFEIKDLTFSYASAKGRHSLENVSLTIEQGEFLVLCGKSGSGKSTLLRQLKTVLTPNG